ncbi:hypothetical protein KU306_09005 [Haloferax larsenii]|uniref:Uncharacterized protein n=1 Tax=Haloferax larsenii TaxID=302484 RepID=A0ABY5RAA9_HALLR|nr:hypothetical protein [Haloferax larsenii]UVE49074.1 hypothetical protein KU306_09005 [Haloferax larsenii]
MNLEYSRSGNKKWVAIAAVGAVALSLPALSYFNYVSGATAGAFNTAILVVITFLYVIYTQSLVVEGRKDRKRPVIHEILEETIRPTLDRAAANVQTLDTPKSNDKPSAFLPVASVPDPNQKHVFDIRTVYPDFAEDVATCNELREKYHETRQDAIEALSWTLETNITVANRDVPDDVEEFDDTVKDAIEWTETQQSELADWWTAGVFADFDVEHSTQLARDLIELTDPAEQSYPYQHTLLSEYRDELLAVRAERDIYQQLLRDHENLRDQTETLLEKLRETRDQLTAEYDIMRTEIGE